MAEKSKAKSAVALAKAGKKRRIVKPSPRLRPAGKKSETVRQKREKAADVKPKQRRVRQTVGKANKPLRAAARGVAKVVRPLNPLLAPFRTRPARFVGRILAKVLFINYFRASWQELRQVTWPDRRETFKLTIAVFVFAISFALLIAVLDFGLDKVFKQLLV